MFNTSILFGVVLLVTFLDCTSEYAGVENCKVFVESSTSKVRSECLELPALPERSFVLLNELFDGELQMSVCFGEDVRVLCKSSSDLTMEELLPLLTGCLLFGRCSRSALGRLHVESLFWLFRASVFPLAFGLAFSASS